MLRLNLLSFLVLILPSLLPAQSGLPTYEEAREESELTGRPIFAMGGRDT